MVGAPENPNFPEGGSAYFSDFSEVVLGIGSVLPLLETARSFRGILLETLGCPEGFRIGGGVFQKRVQIAHQVDQAGRGEPLL